MKVLIVDDDPDVRSFLLTCIGTMDCDTVDTAETGEEARCWKRGGRSGQALNLLDVEPVGSARGLSSESTGPGLR